MVNLVVHVHNAIFVISLLSCSTEDLQVIIAKVTSTLPDSDKASVHLVLRKPLKHCNPELD
jgi:hypothetical protein